MLMSFQTKSPSGSARLRVALAAGAALALSTGTAFAHATFEVREAAVGGAYKGVVKIGHGCKGGAATTKLSVTIPEGVIAAKPMPKAGWTLATVKGAYAKSYKYYGTEKVAEGVKQITWSGGELSDDNYDEFVISMYLTDSLTPGTTLYFPIVQTCTEGENRWVEIPAAGQDAHALAKPAAGVRLLPAKMAAAPAVAAITFKTLVIEAPGTRATPGGVKNAGGYVRVTNKGTESDRLIGGTFASAARVEVHDMTMTDGVMRMRKLDDGIEIKPGETIELKPGGTHLMFLGLTDAVKEGAPVKGSLLFQKAGAVDVEFSVAPIGGGSASSGGAHQH
jgi:uncharacterized protein YcnI